MVRDALVVVGALGGLLIAINVANFLSRGDTLAFLLILVAEIAICAALVKSTKTP
jgi:hypothetical protein